MKAFTIGLLFGVGAIGGVMIGLSGMLHGFKLFER